MIVRAKRLGWDEKLTAVQEYDMDPYDHASADLVGELVTLIVPATAEHGEIRQTLVGGQEADPKTIVDLTAE